MGTLESKWEPVSSVPRGSEPPGQLRFALDPAQLFARTGQDGVYLISGELKRVSVNSPNSANRWMREWSFTPEEAARIAGARPTLFPTLNLSEVARIMEGSLATAAERNGGGITGFAILLKVEN